MKLVDLNQTIFVPVVDETKGGMMVEMKMTVGEFFSKFCQGFEPNVVDAAPVVHGRWIIDTAFGNDVMSNGRMVLCSECGQGLFTGGRNYCPNCGAKMDGERRDEDA